MAKPKYNRVLLKVSGEAFCKLGGSGIDPDALARIADEIAQVAKLGVQLTVVVGAGNIMRGCEVAERLNIPEATGHYMGMIATLLNALALQEALEARDVTTRVASSIAVHAVCEPFIRRRSIRHMEKGRVVVLAGGTGRPFVTTDTGAAAAAAELGAEAVLKATKVDGVYSADPAKNPDAKFYDKLTFRQVIDQRLEVIDVSAAEMCQRNGIPILVFNLYTPGTMRRAVLGEKVGTIIS